MFYLKILTASDIFDLIKNRNVQFKTLGMKNSALVSDNTQKVESTDGQQITNSVNP